MNVDDITVLDPIYSTVHELNEKTFYVKTVLHLFLKYNTIQYNTIQYEGLSNTLPKKQYSRFHPVTMPLLIFSCINNNNCFTNCKYTLWKVGRGGRRDTE
jgi:hypothetical protein